MVHQPKRCLGQQRTVGALVRGGVVEPLQFEGTIQQIPLMYSAIQVQGRRLYDLARVGEIVEVSVRMVQVDQIQVLDWRPGELAELDVAITCGSGTYIRAIARDLGDLLNTGGTLASLTRTQSCGFHLQDSLTLEALEAQLQQGIFQPIPPVTALQHLAVATLPSSEADRWCLGQRILWNNTSTDVPTNALRVQREEGEFLGIGQVISSENGLLLAPQMVFASAE